MRITQEKLAELQDKYVGKKFTADDKNHEVIGVISTGNLSLGAKHLKTGKLSFYNVTEKVLDALLF